MAAPDPYINRTILDGQFTILSKIGMGGMGGVYKAKQAQLDRHVAIKILHSKLKNRKDLVSRFRREARAMSRLQHPNTVKVMMYGELKSGELYIVMEFLEGKNLNQIVRSEGPLSPERAIPILLQVCGALHEAHDFGMVHRDLKPENIFLSEKNGDKEFATVLDFGLAKVTEVELRPGSVMLTQQGMVFGTPEFMSPEQAQGATLDRRSDIYSLAVILYEALTKKLPYDARTPMEYIQKHVTTEPININERTDELTFDPRLGEILSRALSKTPGNRQPSTAVLGTELAELLGPEVAAHFKTQLILATAEGVVPHELDGALTIPLARPKVDLAKHEPPAAKVPAVAKKSGASTTTLVLVSVISILVGVAGALLLMKYLS